MRIFGKSKLNNDIYDKIKKGADAIELHLDDDFLNSKDYWDEEIIDKVDIRVVHAPLTKTNNTDIEEIASREIMVRTCSFAQRIATVQKHPVIVVCHLATSHKLLKKLGVYEGVVFFMRDLINMFPNIEIAIENVIRFKSDRDDYIGFQNVSFEDAVVLVSDIAHERVGTCLDTCHAMVDIGLINYVTGYLRKTGEINNAEMVGGLDAFFESYKETVKLVHLSNAQSHGLYNDHGMPFTKNDDSKLSKILSLYKKYHYGCPITIEVQELDYSNARYFQMTLNSIHRVLNALLSENNS
jgi:sugar phosphate isomerase/epimerase